MSGHRSFAVDYHGPPLDDAGRPVEGLPDMHIRLWLGTDEDADLADGYSKAVYQLDASQDIEPRGDIVWRAGIPYTVRPLHTLSDGHPAKTLLDVVTTLLDNNPHGRSPADSAELAAKCVLVNCSVIPLVSFDSEEFDELVIEATFKLKNLKGWRP